MLPVVSTTAMRNADAVCIANGTPAIELMARAGAGIFASYDFPTDKPTAILCGSGNNGGDGYVLALLLREQGYACTLILAEERWSADGRYYFDKCQEQGIPTQLWSEDTDLSGYGLLVDCLFGTGFRGPVRPPYREIIHRANASGVPILAVDIPSGLSGDSGIPATDACGTVTCIRATVTVSIGTRKLGHYLGAGKDWCGTLTNRDIGIPVENPTVFVPEEGDFHEILPRRAQASHKGTYGYVAVMGGCTRYGGAVKLANLAAASLRSGCGVVKLLCAESLTAAVSPYLLESTLAPLPDVEGDLRFAPDALADALRGTTALAVGMGWGNGPDNEKILTWLLENYEHRLILDADGLNCLGRLESDKRTTLLRERLSRFGTRPILTPHPKEFERISGVPMSECARAPVTHAMAYAKENGVILLLKGTTTIVTDGDICHLIPRGCAGMATAGSGDVLSGVLAGIHGYNAPSAASVSCGAYVTGLAGELAQAEVGEIGMIASDTVRCLPQAVLVCSQGDGGAWGTHLQASVNFGV